MHGSHLVAVKPGCIMLSSRRCKRGGLALYRIHGALATLLSLFWHRSIQSASFALCTHRILRKRVHVPLSHPYIKSCCLALATRKLQVAAIRVVSLPNPPPRAQDPPSTPSSLPSHAHARSLSTHTHTHTLRCALLSVSRAACRQCARSQLPRSACAPPLQHPPRSQRRGTNPSRRS